MVERQLRWKRVKSDDVIENDRNLLEYYILIVNEPKEIKNIESKVYAQLQPIMDMSLPITESIKGTNGLNYSFLRFKSSSSNFKPKEAYNGKVFWDRDLYPRQKEGMLEEYILKIIGAN